ncbi:hypothetical protein BMR22_12465 [Escherichia marmotae]|nr:hypothetical protein BMR22_12465 [Escherichia marmotae]PGF88911.1 hypothetical protein BMR23_00420 [Escherichia marmotae]
MMYCAQTPELPHKTAAIRTFSIPFLVELIFSSAYCFVVYVAGMIAKMARMAVFVQGIFIKPVKCLLNCHVMALSLFFDSVLLFAF